MSILERHQVIAVEGGETPQYRFRDDITRAIAYSMIPATERLELHRTIADAMEKATAGTSRALAAALAHHRERAGQHREAAHWYERVAHLAARTGMNREARYFADRWADVVERLRAVSQITASNDYLVRFKVDGYEITLFADARAIIKGTDDETVARSL